jgi:hypothetical protein
MTVFSASSALKAGPAARRSHGLAAGRIFGVFWEAPVQRHLYMDGERFNELQVYRASAMTK